MIKNIQINFLKPVNLRVPHKSSKQDTVNAEVADDPTRDWILSPNASE